MKKLKNIINLLLKKEIIVQQLSIEDRRLSAMLSFSIKRALERSFGSINEISCKPKYKSDDMFRILDDESNSCCVVCKARKSRIFGVLEELNSIIEKHNIELK
jgi:hypothetical protein